MNRRRFLTSAASAVTLAGAKSLTASAECRGETKLSAAGEPSLSAAPGAPNILIFMPDQQNGATVLPGSPVVKPNMDGFLKQAVAFTAAHCPAPHCCPSRASFMTGLYPSEHGVFNNVTNDTAIHPNPFPGTPYWGLWLRDAGYNMGYAGKLHVGRDVTPETCGFENVSHLEQDSLRENESRKEQQWKTARQQTGNPAGRKPGEYLRPDWPGQHLYRTLPEKGGNGYEDLADARIVAAGVAKMKQFAKEGKPWCMMISNSGGHDPYDAPKKFVDMYDPQRVELPESFKDVMDDKPRVYQRQRYQFWSQLSNEETRDALRHYYAKCSLQDALFGDILKGLEESGQSENTIVIYVSDHGDYRAAHGLWMKGVPSFQEAYHIPAVVRWPKGIKNSGREVEAFVDQTDWGPTILEACGVRPQKPLSGHSLMPWLRGEEPVDWRTFTCSQMNGVELYYTQRITMTKDWKYVYNGFDYDELYDRRNDPHEMHNLAFPDLATKRVAVLGGHGLPEDANLPWPPLSQPAEDARKDLLAKMWTFAAKHHDTIFNPYGTVAFAPYGPGLGADPGS